MKIEMTGDFFLKASDTKFNENAFSGGGVLKFKRRSAGLLTRLILNPRTLRPAGSAVF
jgi:hypothetical protein